MNYGERSDEEFQNAMSISDAIYSYFVIDEMFESEKRHERRHIERCGCLPKHETRMVRADISKSHMLPVLGTGVYDNSNAMD